MQVLNPTTSNVLQFMTHNSLETYKKIGSMAAINKRVRNQELSQDRKYKKGVVFVSPSKALLTEGKGHIITSYESLIEQANKLTHWTPNTFRGGTYYDFSKRIIKGHTKDNLKQINAISFDIDTKRVDLYALFLGCDELGLPRPNLLLETPNGFQGFFILESPFYITNSNEYRSLRIAERIADNVLEAINSFVPIDFGCSPFGFYRIPNDSNIIYFDDQAANTRGLIEWSQTYEKEQSKKKFQVVYNKNASAFDETSSDWYKELINCHLITPGFMGTSRNNTLLTLAIANYASGVAFEEAYNVLDQFNSNLDYPLSIREFERTIKSAYSGRYKGAKREYVENLLRLWTNSETTFHGREGWYKFKKDRSDRQRSHYEEWEQDILMYLEEHSDPETPFISGSLPVLARTFDMPLSTLKEVLKRSNRLVKRVTGRGCQAKTMIASRSMLFKALLRSRKEYLEQMQLSFIELLPEANHVLNSTDFPDLDDLLVVYQNSINFGSRAAPRVRLIS